MSDKKFIGSCKPGKFPEQIEIGLRRDDLDFLLQNLNQSGYVNLRINKGRESGKPYCEYLPPTTK